MTFKSMLIPELGLDFVFAGLNLVVLGLAGLGVVRTGRRYNKRSAKGAAWATAADAFGHEPARLDFFPSHRIRFRSLQVEMGRIGTVEVRFLCHRSIPLGG